MGSFPITYIDPKLTTLTALPSFQFLASPPSLSLKGAAQFFASALEHKTSYHQLFNTLSATLDTLMLKLRANERKNCQHGFETFDRFQTLHKNSQQQATTCNRVCKRIQSVNPTMLS